jgi:hypothetical protein
MYEYRRRQILNDFTQTLTILGGRVGWGGEGSGGGWEVWLGG